MLKLHSLALAFLAFGLVGCTTSNPTKASYSLNGKTYYQITSNTSNIGPGPINSPFRLSNANYIKFEKATFTYTSFGELINDNSKYKVSGEDVYYANDWSSQRYMMLGTLRSNGEVIQMLTGTNGALEGWFVTESFLTDVMEVEIQK